ncbi:hypothetical protein BDB01DRAFT_832644 [Pilobolus umbonatus]|nr:hypothetical protein BDB01DRAFT_832644 [Pilobolus umbonatus]
MAVSHLRSKAVEPNVKYGQEDFFQSMPYLPLNYDLYRSYYISTWHRVRTIRPLLHSLERVDFYSINDCKKTLKELQRFQKNGTSREKFFVNERFPFDDVYFSDYTTGYKEIIRRLEELLSYDESEKLESEESYFSSHGCDKEDHEKDDIKEDTDKEDTDKEDCEEEGSGEEESGEEDSGSDDSGSDDSDSDDVESVVIEKVVYKQEEDTPKKAAEYKELISRLGNILVNGMWEQETFEKSDIALWCDAEVIRKRKFCMLDDERVNLITRCIKRSSKKMKKLTEENKQLQETISGLQKQIQEHSKLEDAKLKPDDLLLSNIVKLEPDIEPNGIHDTLSCALESIETSGRENSIH